MHAYFMRHGETRYNELGLCNDDPNVDVRLTELGERQAFEAAERLRDVPIELIVVSELPRTHDTARIINRDHHAPVIVHAGINDIRTGFEGRPAVEHRRAIAHDPLRAQPPGGESILEYKARVLSFLEWLAQRPEGVVLVVTHEEALRVILAHFRGLSDEEMLYVNVGNAEVLDFRV